MRKINFTKMVASGNDFVVIKGIKSRAYAPLAKKMCDRKFGIGADGLLVLENSKTADIRMRIFNADGSEAEMCGNGARCVSLYSGRKNVSLETRAGIILSEVAQDNVRIRLTEPKDIKLDIPIKVNNRNIKVSFINTGVPHAVIFVQGLDKIDVDGIGRSIRYHRKFAPRGTNVDFVEILDRGSLKIRTYERGVESETLACGTGTVASALVFASKSKSINKVKVHTAGKEILTVYFKQVKNKFSDVWLEGRAKIVYQGEYYV
ncbi:MAG: diaminopimelate epimerase [Candidatus Omnitrophica bacterium]|nr:diaminopimelate epimerase [Candidatus Omnitrophota bacterium]